MASLFVILIIAVCTAYFYLKSTLIKSFGSLIVAICSVIVSFNYFEVLADVIIKRAGAGFIANWAQAVSFLLITILAFAILQTILAKLTAKPLEFGIIPERVSRIGCGVFVGLIAAGLLLTTVMLTPLSSKYPYQRFDPMAPDAQKPNKILLNPDGFVTSMFGSLSQGAFSKISEKKSFAALHPAFQDQLFLNRHVKEEGLSLLTSAPAIEVLRKDAAWLGSDDLVDSDNRAVTSKSGHSLTVVRVGIRKKLLKEVGKFTPSQLRLVCTDKTAGAEPFASAAKAVYPLGYLVTANQLQRKQLGDLIVLDSDDFTGSIRWIDFVFDVPANSVPMLIEFKLNNIAKLPGRINSEPPETIQFIPTSKCAQDIAKIEPVSSDRISGSELASGNNLLKGFDLEIESVEHWRVSETNNSIEPAQFDGGKTNYVRAEMEIVKDPGYDEKKNRSKRRKGRRPKSKGVTKMGQVAAMLMPMDGYNLVSLKCKKPGVGSELSGDQLPVLLELGGGKHYPVGVIAMGRIGDGTKILYEVDYCSLSSDDITGGLVIGDQGRIAKAFPPEIWLTESATEIEQFYVLYLIESGRNVIITSVQPFGSKNVGRFKGYEGFLVK
ncbi:hypothetical protein ACFL3G_07870 [Planctomycetota bacterium]